ncbi:MAG: right-handed parallel beta-helix repeat-containing protein [Planctomycetota bacterium]
MDFLGKAVIVRSIDPNEPSIVAGTIINCEGTWFDRHRAFNFHCQEGADSVVDGLTITNGFAPITGTYQWSIGGAIYCNQSSPTIKNCIIANNMASGSPGPYSYIFGTGAGIEFQDSNSLVEHCVIRDNGALMGWSEPEFPETVAGGGICASESNVILRNCIITANAAAMGGGVSSWESDLTVRNCVISGNIAFYGAAAQIDANTLINNCSVIHNECTAQGGIIDCRGSGQIMINNCILWDNVASEIISGTPSVVYSNVQGGWPGLGNIVTDPCFADPCNGDYHLQSTAGRWDPNVKQWVIDANTSRCIDAGNPGSGLGDEPNDANNVRINMGAYGGTAAASMPPYDWALLSDITNDGIVDFVDFGHLAGMYIEQDDELPADFDRDGGVDYADLKLLAEDWLKETTWHE